MSLIIKKHSGMYKNSDSFFLEWKYHHHIFHRNGLREICHASVISALEQDKEIECIIVTKKQFEKLLAERYVAPTFEILPAEYDE